MKDGCTTDLRNSMRVDNLASRITVMLGFDMETDLGSWTPYYEGIKRGTSKIIDLLSNNNIQATFFFTGEAAKLYPKIVKTVAEEKHEVGCHALYHETVGDSLFPIPGIRPLLPEEVFPRIEKATEYVEEALGDKMASFRAPRLWGSSVLVNVLEELGYIADVSYPLYYYGERLVPYHPDRHDWTKEGNMKILEIPNFADITIESKDPYGRDRDQWPSFRTQGSKVLMKHIENFIQYVANRNSPAILCFYFHPWEFVKMPTGLIHYGEGSVLPDGYLSKNCGDYALDELDRLIKMLKLLDTQFCTAKKLAGIWDEMIVNV